MFQAILNRCAINSITLGKTAYTPFSSGIESQRFLPLCVGKLGVMDTFAACSSLSLTGNRNGISSCLDVGINRHRIQPETLAELFICPSSIGIQRNDFLSLGKRHLPKLVRVSPLVDHVEAICRPCSKPKVCRVDTRGLVSIGTIMQNTLVLRWPSSVFKVPTDHMGSDKAFLFSRPDHAVACTALARCPNPAFIRASLDNFFPKAVCQRHVSLGMIRQHMAAFRAVFGSANTPWQYFKGSLTGSVGANERDFGNACRHMVTSLLGRCGMQLGSSEQGRELAGAGRPHLTTRVYSICS
jgi:hypothetical protein